VDGEGRIVVDIPEQYDAGSIVDEFLHSFPDADLVRKHR
jgi:hypothetical protein